MRNKLQVITHNWLKQSYSQPKIKAKQESPYIRLNQKKRNKISQDFKTEQLLTLQSQNVQTDARRVIRKVTTFIQKMEETIKKILYKKDVKWYLTYAKTSQAQIMDNVSSSLNKFKQILYKLKQNDQQECYTPPQRNTSNSITSVQSHSDLNIHNFIDNRFKMKKIKINLDLIQFVIQYFQDHMISETHWSTKQKKKVSKVNFFQKYFGKFKLNQCTTQQSIKDDNNGSSQLKLRQQMSQIFEQIQKQESLTNIKQGQAHIVKKPVEEALNALLKIQQLKSIQEMTSVQQIAYLLDLQSKIFVSSQFVQSAAYFQDDITTLSKQKYESTWQFIHQNSSGDVKVLNQEYKMMKMLMIITNASVIRQLQANMYENSWFKKLVFGLSFPRYYLDYGRAKLQNNKFLRNPNVQQTKSIWNLPQNGFIKELKKPFIFDKIAANIEFYIPRVNSRNLKNFKIRKYSQKLDIFVPNQNSIRVRLLNYKVLNIGNKKDLDVHDTIIIHYHGGGFIALSSCTSQSYTRKWANSLKVPVFSVDYGKPPEFRFPTPVLDCLESYKFISEQIHKYINIRPKRIIVAGDSAGGNLACSVTALALKLQLTTPYGIFLAYPAVDTRNQFSPSRMNSFNDIILYPTLLLLCMQQYLGENQQNQHHPLASPILLTEQYVSEAKDDRRWPLKWPRTIVVVGKKDPLYDDSLRLCERMASSKIEFHCEMYKHFSHAFLSIDKMIPQCSQTIQDSIKFFKKLISGQSLRSNSLI